jgi:hypothetical protein
MPNDPNQSVAVWDLAPDDGGAPGQVQMIRSYADEQIALRPKRCVANLSRVSQRDRRHATAGRL